MSSWTGKTRTVRKKALSWLCERQDKMKLSARNKLLGTVKQIQRGAVNSIVQIELAATPTVTAVITNDAVDDLELVEGGQAVAVIKASNVLVGICQEGQGCGCQTGE